MVFEIPPCTISTFLLIIVARGSQLKTSCRRYKITFPWTCKVYPWIRSFQADSVASKFKILLRYLQPSVWTVPPRGHPKLQHRQIWPEIYSKSHSKVSPALHLPLCVLLSGLTNVIYFIPQIAEHKMLPLCIVLSVMPLKIQNNFNYVTKLILHYTYINWFEVSLFRHFSFYMCKTQRKYRETRKNHTLYLFKTSLLKPYLKIEQHHELCFCVPFLHNFLHYSDCQEFSNPLFLLSFMSHLSLKVHSSVLSQ